MSPWTSINSRSEKSRTLYVVFVGLPGGSNEHMYTDGRKQAGLGSAFVYRDRIRFIPSSRYYIHYLSSMLIVEPNLFLQKEPNQW